MIKKGLFYYYFDASKTNFLNKNKNKTKSFVNPTTVIIGPYTYKLVN